MSLKRCTKCNIELPIESFTLLNGVHGRRPCSRCKKCVNQYRVNHRKLNVEYFRNKERERARRHRGWTEYVGHIALARKWELFTHKILKGSKDCNKYSFRFPWDIEWLGKKIDVKVRRLSKDLNASFKNNKKADYILCILLKGDTLNKMFLIPTNRIKSSFNYGEKVDKSFLKKYEVLLDNLRQSK